MTFTVWRPSMDTISLSSMLAASARPTDFSGGHHPVDPLLHSVKPGVRLVVLVR